MRRIALAVAAAAVLGLGAALPAQAHTTQSHEVEERTDSADGYHSAEGICRDLRERRSAEEQEGRPQIITKAAYWVPMTFAGGFVDELPILSFKGCVDTVEYAGEELPVPYDALSDSAVRAQCRYLERLGAVSYPYAFYGDVPGFEDRYVAEDRKECIRFLRGFHLGLLETPSAPPNGD
jgi:hypothetical protein